MKARNLYLTVGFVFSAILSTATSAKAASFISNISQNTDPKADILLNSITQNGKTFSNFSYVNSANILFNTPKTITPLNDGAASTDKGDKANAPLPPNEQPTGAEIAAYLGNNNLNNIIDTEDTGSFVIDIFFDHKIVKDHSGLDNIFYWERGLNSSIGIQALDHLGNLIGNFITITPSQLTYAGFNIDTTEVTGAQPVGSWGISLDSLGVTSLSGLKLTAHGSNNGPDFKIIARKTTPEPTTVLGLGAVATLAFLRRRQFKSNFLK
ncbi:exosortase-dependent surface protein XDP2 [Anabaena subtropica]|uniref:PEP-CTERM sorting domain-containing protein n=1 Tax=Anabaena subtropica FACHB-260 TaxID=2692884 RepID=A0ABR8CVN1_9NOST|nr:exosortase-dependent surface protein XDP2 [Anabaena subtropica]MBD2347257.1 PEP-CTERM sorting domain-containing protein [Anabaena subtropica FACHB-260]